MTQRLPLVTWKERFAQYTFVSRTQGSGAGVETPKLPPLMAVTALGEAYEQNRLPL